MCREFLEPLGAQHGDDEVEEEGEGDDAEDDGFHGKGRAGARQRTFSQK